jgi:hypothetical protein
LENEKLNILKSIFGSYYENGGERLFHCPKCNHSKRKLSINLEKNVFKCWVCDFAGKKIEYLVGKHGDANQILEWKSLHKVNLAALDNFNSLFEDQKILSPPVDLDLPHGFVSLTGTAKGSEAALKYLDYRGITKKDILAWKLGFCKTDDYANRIIVPSFDNEGNLNYYVGRSYDKNQWPRYKNPKASKDIIFNDLLIDWTNPITLVEGVFDAIKAKNSIALLGSTLRENSVLFRKIVKHSPLVYIALDNDAYAKSLKICEMLRKHDIKTKIILLPKEKDIAEMNKEEVEKLYNTATVIDSDNYLLYEIQKI